jgi:hypothetical protein
MVRKLTGCGIRFRVNSAASRQAFSGWHPFVFLEGLSGGELLGADSAARLVHLRRCSTCPTRSRLCSIFSLLS